jgi:dCTP deaminase
MLLVDQDIHLMLKNGSLKIFVPDSRGQPFDGEKQVQSGSIDLRVQRVIRRYPRGGPKKPTIVSTARPAETIETSIEPSNPLRIHPQEIILAATLETVILPPNIGGIITGRSSISRLGLMVQASQDFVQPGHRQSIALQLVNVSSHEIEIDLSICLCQLVLIRSSQRAERPYDGKYVDESTPQPSKISEDLATRLSKTKNRHTNSPESDELSRQVFDASEKSARLKSGIQNIGDVLLLTGGATLSVVYSEIGPNFYQSTKAQVAGLTFIICLALFLIIRSTKKSV